jgi:hypothetical protein
MYDLDALDGPYSPAYVQKQLGHSSISITVDIYGHWIPGEGKKDLTRTLRGPRARPGQTLKAVGDNRPQRPQQAIPGFTAYSAVPVRDEVGDKLGHKAKTKGATN